jgi:hypothetical protein
MAEVAQTLDAAVGFRVKSGFAIAVLVTGPIESPSVIDRRVIDLCDPDMPESRQPYHSRMGQLETDDAKVQRRRKAIVQATQRSVPELVKEYRDADRQIRAAGLVVGSEIDPSRITNPHIRAHALEGQLFRTVLGEALQSCGLTFAVVTERNIYKHAAKILRRSEADLKGELVKLGRARVGSWRADEKTACLAAWLALA